MDLIEDLFPAEFELKEEAVNLNDKCKTKRMKSIQMNDLGNVYYNQGDFDRALSCYNQAIELDQHNSIAYTNRANLFADFARKDNGYYKLAINDYSIALVIEPENFEILYNRGVTHKENNQFDKALEDFLNVIQMNPEFDNAYYNLGIILYQKGKETTDMELGKAAIKYFQKAAKLGNHAAIQLLNKLQ